MDTIKIVDIVSNNIEYYRRHNPIEWLEYGKLIRVDKDYSRIDFTSELGHENYVIIDNCMSISLSPYQAIRVHYDFQRYTFIHWGEYTEGLFIISKIDKNEALEFPTDAINSPFIQIVQAVGNLRFTRKQIQLSQYA